MNYSGAMKLRIGLLGLFGFGGWVDYFVDWV